MIKRTALFFLLCLCAGNLQAQWTLQPGVGVALPITGFHTISGPGPMLHIDFNKRLQDSPWGLGFMLGWGRMHHDENSGDIFQNARLDQVPFLFTLDYELMQSHFRPYLGIGLGMSYYNLTFDKSATEGEVDDNVSFSLMPRAGLRYEVNKRIFPFFEVNAPLVMDGSPQGSDHSDQATGYIGICGGLGYRFIK